MFKLGICIQKRGDLGGRPESPTSGSVVIGVHLGIISPHHQTSLKSNWGFRNVGFVGNPSPGCIVLDISRIITRTIGFLIAEKGIFREFAPDFFKLFLGWNCSPLETLVTLHSPNISRSWSLTDTAMTNNKSQIKFNESNFIKRKENFIRSHKNYHTLAVLGLSFTIFLVPCSRFLSRTLYHSRRRSKILTRAAKTQPGN